MDWIKRITHKVEKECEALGMEGWVEAQRRRKWQWAGHVARMKETRWAGKMLGWKPEGARKVGGPKRRWEDAMDGFGRSGGWGKGEWKRVARDGDVWKSSEESFANFGKGTRMGRSQEEQGER